MISRLSALLLIFFLCSSSFGEELFYESNPVGMRLKPLDEGGRSGTEYLLSVRNEGGREVRRLLDKEGKETRRWEFLFSQDGALLESSDYREGVPVSVKHYDTAGRLRDEVVYQDGEEDGLFVYRWAAGRPLAVEFTRPESKSGFKDEYRYLPSGEFLGVVRTYEDGKIYRSLFSYSRGLPREEWHSWGDRESGFTYDKRGNVVLQEVSGGGKLTEKTTFTYHGGPTFLLREKRTRDIAAERETVLVYDDRGHPFVETLFENGVQTAVTKFHYEENLLVRKERQRRNGRDSWEYLHTPEGDLIGEKVFLNDKLKVLIEYTPDEEITSTESHYKDGKIILKVYYRDSKEVKAEYLKDGTVVRTIETGTRP